MSSKKHILFLTPWYPDKKDPMLGLFVQRHALAARLKNEVAVLYVKGYPDQNEIVEEWSSDPLDELRIYYPSAKGIFRGITWIFRMLRFHQKGYQLLIKKWGVKPDVIHVNILTREGIVALLWKWRYGIPYVVTEHWSRYHNGRFTGIIRRLVTRLVIKNASKIMPVTEHLKNAMLNCGLKSERYTIVPNVVNVDRFVPDLKQKGLGKQIIHISCFHDLPKNISGIIDVIARLHKKRSDFKMVFVGDGVDFEELKRYAYSQPNAKQVFEFRGLLEGDDLIKAIQQSDFHLMFSRYENLPVVNLECFACGIPVVSSDVGGIKEHLNPKLGRLVPSEDQQALFEAVNLMLDESASYDKNYIRNYALQHFSEQVIGEQFDAVYEELIH